MAHRSPGARHALRGGRGRRSLAGDRGPTSIPFPRDSGRRIGSRLRRRRCATTGGRLSRRYARRRESLRSRRSAPRVVGPDRARARLMEASMATQEADLVRMREHVEAAIQRSTDLLTDLKSLDDWLQALMPGLARFPESEREAFAARLCGYDAALPQRLSELIEGLADLMAGLTASDGGQAWVRQHVTRLEAGEETDAA